MKPEQSKSIRRTIQRFGFWAGYRHIKGILGKGYFWKYFSMWVEEKL